MTPVCSHLLTSSCEVSIEDVEPKRINSLHNSKESREKNITKEHEDVS